MTKDIFISYSRLDSDVVLPIVKEIEEAGFTVWIDREGIYMGDAFKRSIAKALRESRIVLFFSSENANASEWCEKEVTLAVHLKKDIFPINLDDSEYADAVLFDLVGLDSLSYRPERHEPAMRRLVASLQLKCPVTQQPNSARAQSGHASTTQSQNRSQSQSQSQPQTQTPSQPQSQPQTIQQPAEPVVEPKETSAVSSDASLPEAINELIASMVAVKGGTFRMGSEEDADDAMDWEKPAHNVTLSDFFIGKYPVTQAQREAVMGNNPARYKAHNRPVERVSWDDCQEFIKKLNQLTGRQFRLPTEAEWEYAAKGGHDSSNAYAGAGELDELAWFDKNSNNRSHPVGEKAPNELGLYDMSGNVWEWCQDWYGQYAAEDAVNPTGSAEGTVRVYRGGSWEKERSCCRVAYRKAHIPSFKSSQLGLRLVL